MPIIALLGGVAIFSAPLSACGSPAAGTQGSMQVIAGENFWGSIASQLGGNHVSVTSIVTNPNTDPHEYESSAVDARAFATADYVILNGAGYDDWGARLLSGNPSDNRRQLTVADLLHRRAGDNPHFWYDPGAVEKVADRITADYKAIDPGAASYFDQQREAFRAALKPYHDAITTVRSSQAGTPVGSTESIFFYMASALGVDLISPPRFMQAISEGSDPPAQDLSFFQQQINVRAIRLLVYNTQASSSITRNLEQLAARNGIPVVGVSETIEPAGASFQDWQLAQLEAIKAALGHR